MNDKNETRVCTRCKRDLPIRVFSKHGYYCKNCISSFYTKRNGNLQNDRLITIDRQYKFPIPERILNTERLGIKLVNTDECFVELIDYKWVWISSYGRVLEYNNGRYIFKRQKVNDSGEKICILQKNVYNGTKWVYQREIIEIWKLVVSAFIVNYDMVGNTRCWHKNNNKKDNYYKHIFPVGEKQYNAIMERYYNGETDSEDMIFEITNDIVYKEDDWYENKWKRTNYGIGYLGCNDPNSHKEDRAIYIKWVNMIQRCYSEELHAAKPYYANCTLSPEWHNFSNFRKWYLENKMNDRKVDLDKDILVYKNTHYSPETCTLISHFANVLLERKSNKSNVSQNTSTGKYEACMRILGKKNIIGSFDTYEEAKEAFINYKKDYIMDFAKKCKGKVPNKTYNAMVNWKVEFDKY